MVFLEKISKLSHMKVDSIPDRILIHRITRLQSNNHFFQKWQKNPLNSWETRLSAHFNLESISFFMQSQIAITEKPLQNFPCEDYIILEPEHNCKHLVYSRQWGGIMFPAISLLQLHFWYILLANCFENIFIIYF